MGKYGQPEMGKADDFVFGNLINDPVKRYHYFKSEVKGRYVKIEMVESANQSKYASIAELDICKPKVIA